MDPQANIAGTTAIIGGSQAYIAASADIYGLIRMPILVDPQAYIDRSTGLYW